VWPFRVADGFSEKVETEGRELVTRARWRFVLWTGVIVLLVFPWTSLQNHTHWPRVSWIPFVSPPFRIRDIVVNVLLYVPWGYFGARSIRCARRVWIVSALAALLSLATEASQLYSHGRFPSATDLTCNIFGAFAGAKYARRTTDDSQPTTDN
jgi:glycopeptide antibiotics resistance protein